MDNARRMEKATKIKEIKKKRRQNLNVLKPNQV